MDAILENLLFIKFIGAIICSVGGYIEIMENDLGELGETVEDYNRNWEFQSILLKLYEREFSGTIRFYKSGFFWVSDSYEKPIYNLAFTLTNSISKFFFPKFPIQGYGSKFPSMGNNMPFIFYNPTRMIEKFEPKVENIGFRLLPYYLGNLGKINMEPCLYRGGFNNENLQGPCNENSTIRMLLDILMENCNKLKEGLYTYNKLKKDLILEKICLTDISNVKFRILMEKALNIFGTVEFLNADSSKRLSDGFCHFQSDNLNFTVKENLRFSENWLDRSTYFAMSIPFYSKTCPFNAMIIGEKKGTNVNAFIPVACNANILKKITYSIELIFEVFRGVYKFNSKNEPVKFSVYASGNKGPFCSNLRTLLMVYGFYHDLDMIECINIKNEDLRLLNYFSELPEHMRFNIDEDSEDSENEEFMF